MATVLNVTDEDGFIAHEIRTWYVICDGCGEHEDIDDNPASILLKEGWFVNDDGQFCSDSCYEKGNQ